MPQNNLPFIFNKTINTAEAITILKCNNAVNRETKSVWLIRESSIPGVLTVTYYKYEENAFKNNRLGYGNRAWNFLNQEQETFFAQKNLAGLPENATESLIAFLDKCGFSFQGMIRPNAEQSITFTPAEDNLAQSSTIS